MLGFCAPRVVYSQSELVHYSPSIVTGYYYAPGGVSLGKILKEDISLRPGISHAQLEKIVASIKKFNPSITNWKEIPAGEKLYLEIPYDAVSPDSILFTKKRKIVEEKIIIPDTEEKTIIENSSPVVTDEIKETFVKEDQAVTYLESKIRYSMIASTSTGTFKETSPAGNKITSKQLSPITLGFAVSISDAARLWSFSSSAYFSYLKSQNVPASAALTNTSISTPMEIGITAYAQRMVVPELVSVYTGVDVEKFSTLNLVELEEGRSTTLSTREHKVVYGTLGSSLYLKIKKQPINLRASYSKSLVSDVNVSSVKAYEGYKAIFYIQLPINEHFYLNTFYKYHNMTGESELTVTRIGLGLGYLF